MAIGPAEANEAVIMARSAKVKGAMREIDERSRNYRQPGRLKVLELQARGRNRKMRKGWTLRGGHVPSFIAIEYNRTCRVTAQDNTTQTQARRTKEAKSKEKGHRGKLMEVAEWTLLVGRTVRYTASPGFKASTSNMVSVFHLKLDSMHGRVPFHIL